MTPDQKFARWIKYCSFGFIVLFVYFLVADNQIPLTPQAMATRVVTKVAPRVSGEITKVNVANNQQVKHGDVLFEIDPQPYQLAVEKAQLNLQQVLQNNLQLDASITAARAEVEAAEIVAHQHQREANRLNKLLSKNSVSEQSSDDAHSSATASLASLKAAKARLTQLIVNRGETSDQNISEKSARNELKQAQLNLSYTKVVAKHDGIVTNLQLESGAYAIAGSPLVALVDKDVDIIADFREKSIRDVEDNYQALIAFDAKPGRVYSASVSSIDAGVSAGQFDANGSLANPTDSNRWVRNAQRIRLHFALTDNSNDKSNLSLLENIPTGAKATVQLVPNNSFSKFFAHAQIRFLSFLHFIY